MINIAGVISIVLFYVLILAVGIWAGRKKQEGNDSEEEVMLAGRSIGLFVGIFTMTGWYNVNVCYFKYLQSEFATIFCNLSRNWKSDVPIIWDRPDSLLIIKCRRHKKSKQSSSKIPYVSCLRAVIRHL